MSINGLVGLPGHGKSYSALELFIIQALAANRKIVTNIPLNLPALKSQYPEYDFDNKLLSVDLDQAKNASAEWWESAENWPLSGLYILDELWRIWPAGVKASAVPTHQLAFIKEHRHRVDDTGQEPDIVFVTQNLGDIAACVRDMVETTIICTKLTAVGAKGNFRRDYYQGAVKGLVGPKMAFVRSDQCKYKPEVFELYKSHTKSTGGHKAIDNKGVVNATIFNGLGFKLGVAFLVFLLVVVVWGAKSSMDGVQKLTAKKPAPSETVQSVVQPVSPPVSAPPAPVESNQWRLVGVIDLGPRRARQALISDGSNTIRLNYSKACKQDLEITCIYGGQIVARYTGGSDSSARVSEKLVGQL